MLDPPAAASRFAVVRAPSGLGLRAPGVEGLGGALLGHGLAQALGARVATTVAPPPASGVRDPASGVLNGPEVAAYAVALANAVGAVFDAGEVPLVLGGDCSVLLGGALALRRRGAAGLLFIDGHADFYQPSAEPASKRSGERGTGGPGGVERRVVDRDLDSRDAAGSHRGGEDGGQVIGG